METTKLLDQGQIIIPQIILEQLNWKNEQEILIINTGEGILLKPKKIFPETKLEDVAGCLKYQGNPKTIEEMEEGISNQVKSVFT